MRTKKLLHNIIFLDNFRVWMPCEWTCGPRMCVGDVFFYSIIINLFVKCGLKHPFHLRRKIEGICKDEGSNDDNFFFLCTYLLHTSHHSSSPSQQDPFPLLLLLLVVALSQPSVINGFYAPGDPSSSGEQV